MDDGDDESGQKKNKRDALRSTTPVPFSMFDPIVAYEAISGNWINVPEVAKLGIQAAHKKLGLAREERAEMGRLLDNLQKQFRSHETATSHKEDESKPEHHGLGMLSHAVQNHVESFNAFIDGIEKIAEALPTYELEDPGEGEKLRFWIDNLLVSRPKFRLTDKSYELYERSDKKLFMNPEMLAGTSMLNRPWYPADCRMAHATYSGILGADLHVVGPDDQTVTERVILGDWTASSQVSLRQYPHHGEIAEMQLVQNDIGRAGYFLLHGLERIIRLLIMPRANFPMAVIRPSYKSRGKLYTDHAVLMRCMRPDGSTQTNCLHYLKDGSCTLRFSVGKEEWLIPLSVVCHCVCSISDRFLIELLAGGSVQDAKPGDEPGSNQELWEQVVVLGQEMCFGRPGDSQGPCPREFERLAPIPREHLTPIKVVLGNVISSSSTDEQVGKHMAENFFMVHTTDPWEKLISLCIMFQKLMGLVQGHVEADNQDTMSSHEVLHPGQLYGMILKEPGLEGFAGSWRFIVPDYPEQLVCCCKPMIVTRCYKYQLHPEARKLPCKEAMDVSLLKFRAYMKKSIDTTTRGKKAKLLDYVHKKDLLTKAFLSSMEVQKRMENFLATGNVQSRSGLDLMQVSGFTVVADKLNQARYSSHFASIHRGQYFSEMKTTTVRKLLPETWGFLCPVHTPDGSPCGLLNHLAHSCKPVVHPVEEGSNEAVLEVLKGIGAQRWTGGVQPPDTRSKHAWVMLDGRPVAFLERTRLHFAAQHLRALKLAKEQGIEDNLEIVLITRSWGKLFTGLFLFLGPGRLVRPVRDLQSGKVEWIGPMEQLFLNISVLRAEKRAAHAILDKGKKEKELPEQLPLRFTHEELEPTELFSTLAALTPFSNHNQSPRNMYQCQMLKQTMATPYHNHEFRPDNKVFRIYCPQSPLVRTQMYDKVDCDEHPIGTNAVVAVITYTGYDMEDAMIINKQSYERGFGHGIVYKTKILEAADAKKAENHELEFNCFSNLKRANNENGKLEIVGRYSATLDNDGLPPIGTRLVKGDDFYCIVDCFGKAKLARYLDDEPCFVEQVARVDGKEVFGSDPVKRVMLKLRYTRNPVVGDKFSSRHGQKGVMSILWPAEDMPWTESGLTPDILFNPHGFPSRMTIGMLIESIAGKTAALEAKKTADATTFREYTGSYNNGDNEGQPFLDSDKGAQGPTAAAYFGDTLKKHGYKRLGTERMYSGIHGTEIETDIFVGVVYYQRLRHLVMDKAQVRSRGIVDRITKQPMKGRKNKGGIRFGEMERDSLLAHGTSFLLHDRLMRSSDFDMAYVCRSCGSVITPAKNAAIELMEEEGVSRASEPGMPWECRPCSIKQQKIVRCESMAVPWVFRYLACELASLNVKMEVKLTDRAREVSIHGAQYMGDIVG
eukprot:symbB.v1.2.009255.t1/scaffold562.1/size187303/3